MNLAGIIPTEQRTSVPKKAEKTPPPLTNTGVTSDVTKYHNLESVRAFRPGQEVAIATKRHDRKHFDGRFGTVAAVIYPNDLTRSIVYVRVGKHSPCFYPHELTLVSKSVGEVVA